MKLDQIPENDSTQLVKSKKTERIDKGSSFVDNNTTILELLNPLKSINLTSNLHSFYNFKELTKQVEVLMRSQSNIIFYILHQNFMCDDAHKEFFKNMVGRFYDMPEWSWKYYQGLNGVENTIVGLVLTENYPMYKRYNSLNNRLHDWEFSTIEDDDAFSFLDFNACAIFEYFGVDIVDKNGKYFSPFNRKFPTNTKKVWSNRLEPNTFVETYEFGRTQPLIHFIKQKDENKSANSWFIASLDWIRTTKIITKENFEDVILNYGIYASIGLDNFESIIAAFRERADELDVDWEDYWESEWPDEDNKKIRSLSQTFPWTKEYIFENEDILDLDVLGLNMTVPWDMELVKFFIDRGYGGRMSENKAVFDKVFEPILTDGIIEKLFNCEYKPYE